MAFDIHSGMVKWFEYDERIKEGKKTYATTKRKLVAYIKYTYMYDAIAVYSLAQNNQKPHHHHHHHR